MEPQALIALDVAMARLKDGDRKACGFVFSSLWPPLVAFARRTLGNVPEAHDAAQQALEKLFAQAALYDSKRSTLAWALAMTAWECRTTLQKRKRRRESTLDDDGTAAMPASSPDAEKQLIERAVSTALHESLAELSERDRATLEEAFFREDKSADAHLPRGRDSAFRKRKERALARLRAVWSKSHGE